VIAGQQQQPPDAPAASAYEEWRRSCESI
jgi:hypothetical protein